MSECVVLVSLIDKYVSVRARRDHQRSFKWTHDFVKNALKALRMQNLAVDLQPQDHVSMTNFELAKCRMLGDKIKLRTRPKDGSSAWEYDIVIRSRPCDAQVIVHVFDAIREACNRQNPEPKKTDQMNPKPSISSNNKVIERQELEAAKQQALSQLSPINAVAALDSMMKAAARLDVANDEITELRKNIAELRDDQQKIKNTITIKEDRLAQLELEIESDPNARLAKSFIETMSKMISKA